jgi:hypothetical protein
MEIRNSKREIRNKLEGQILKTLNDARFESFAIWSFGIVSDFEFRYSDLAATEGCLGV